MKLVPLTRERNIEWGDFISRFERGGFIYTLDFKEVVQSVFRVESRYLLFYEEDQVVGVLPLIVKNRNTFVSMPFCEYGGILCEERARESISRALCSEFEGKNLELKFNNGLEMPGFKKQGIGESAFLKMSQVDDHYLDRVDYSVRKNLKTAKKNNINIEISTAPVNYVDEYFRVSRMHYTRHHGSPYLPREFYSRLFVNKNAVLAVARQDKKIVGFLLGWFNHRHMEIIEVIGFKEYWNTRFTDMLHYELILWARKQSLDMFDFGIVRYEGQKKYKQKWGVEFIPYDIYFLGKMDYKSPDSSSARLARSVWRHLPFWVTDKLTWYARRIVFQ